MIGTVAVTVMLGPFSQNRFLPRISYRSNTLSCLAFCKISKPISEDRCCRNFCLRADVLLKGQFWELANKRWITLGQGTGPKFLYCQNGCGIEIFFGNVWIEFLVAGEVSADVAQIFSL